MTPVTPTEAHVRHFTESLLAEHGLHGWSVGFDRSKRRAGLCDYEKKSISFSRALIKARPIEASLMTAKHEVAHVLAGARAGHGPEWKRIFIQLGGDGSRGYDGATVDRSKIQTRYTARCPSGHEVHISRMVISPRSCGKCEPSRFDAQHLMIFIDNRTGQQAEYAKPPVRRNTRRPSSVAANSRG